MTTLSSVQTFDRIALTAAVRAHPGAVDAQGALCDYLQEIGYTYIGARREVIRHVREGTEERHQELVQHIWDTTIAGRQHIRRTLADWLAVDEYRVERVTVKTGAEMPGIIHARHYWRSTEGEIKHGVTVEDLRRSKWKECREPERVDVGAEWVLARLSDVFRHLELI